VKKLIFGVLVVILLLGTMGCAQEEVSTVSWGSGESPEVYSGGRGDEKYAAPQMTSTVAPATTTTIVVSKEETAAYDHDGAAVIERMVIKSASMALVVEDVTATLQQITGLASVNGGYVVNSDMQEDQNRLYAYISFRVNAALFDATLQSLRNMAVDVRSESTSGQDVTEEYVDLDAKLRNLEASEAQLLELMKQAGTVEEILKVQQVLVDTRQDIEQTKGRMQYLEQSASLSYVYVSLEQSKLTLEFNASSTTVKEGEKIRFYPNVNGGFEPYSYEWNFGDGDTSTEASPVHTYKNNGTYTVTLAVKDDKGTPVSAERKDYITILSGWDAGNVVSSAWNGLVAFGRFLGTVFIGLGIFSPVWIAILVILYFAWWRRRKKKS